MNTSVSGKISNQNTEGISASNLVNLNQNEIEMEFISHTKQIQSYQPNNENIDEITKESVNKTGWRKYAGITFSVLAALTNTFSNLLNKILIQRNYHPVNIGVWRYQCVTICVPLYVIYLRIIKHQHVFAGLWEDKGKALFFLLVRGTLGFCAVVLYTFSLQYLKLADATVITFSTPIVVTLFARICLGEPCGIVTILVALVTLSGVVVLTRPPLLTGSDSFDYKALIGTSLAFTTMLIVTSVFVVIRYLRKLHFTLPILSFGYVASIEGLIVCWIFELLELPRTSEDWFITCGAAVITLFGQIFQTLSLKYEEAGPVALVRTLDIVFAFIVQLIFFGVYPDIFSVSSKISNQNTEGISASNLVNLNQNEIEMEFISHTKQIQSVQPNNEKIDVITKESVNKTGWRKYAGIAFSVLAALNNSFSAVSSKILTQRNYHPVNIAVWRYQCITICVPLYVIYLRIVKKQNVLASLWEDEGKSLFLLLVRGTLGFGAIVLYTFSLQYLKLADATVITFSTPIVVTLFARICLGEPCGIVPILAALVTLSGVVVLTRPPLLTGSDSFDDKTLIGTSLAFTTMLTATSVFVLIRYLRKLHFTLPILAFGYVASIEGLIVCWIFGLLELPRTSEDWFIACGSAVITFSGQIFLTLSFKYEEAGPVALVRTLDIVFAFILQLIFLGVYPDIFSIIGASIIMAGIIFTTFRKWLSTLPEKDPSKLKYWFMLK